MRDLERSTPYAPRFALVREIEAAPPEVAQAHFASRLAFETDPTDLAIDLAKGHRDIVVVDARTRADFVAEHVAGAMCLPHREISADTTAALSKDMLYITYCWGPGCNGSTRAALLLSALGFRVKELMGGIEYWKRDGHPTEGSVVTGGA